MVTLNALGPLLIAVGGRPVRLRSRRQRAVLAVLIANAGKLTSVDQLLGALWGDDPPDTAVGQIQTVVEMMVDCDQDAIVIRIRPRGDGGVCHTGEMSCFYRVVEGGALVPREGTVLAGAGKAG